MNLVLMLPDSKGRTSGLSRHSFPLPGRKALSAVGAVQQLEFVCSGNGELPALGGVRSKGCLLWEPVEAPL
jgi:hypothetical protein